MSSREELILKLGRNRVLAHQTLFQHRHNHATPEFHKDLISGWYSNNKRVLFMAFRGAAKSTIAEEAVVISSLFGECKNVIILGESETRAVDRLRSIKHELENNEYIDDLFGSQVGETWAEKRIVTSRGVCIQAYGRGQSLRGVKHLDQRPDLAVGDDMEDEESVATPLAREKMLKWWEAVVMPSLDPDGRVRVNATPLDPDALAMRLAKSDSWVLKRYPVKTKDEKTGEWVPTWPERFSMKVCDKIENDLSKNGLHDIWAREYMCEPVSEKAKAFTADMLPPPSQHARSWHMVQAFYDPARTAKVTSAHTGYAVWSWIGRRLVVWESGGKHWKPDEMIADMFRCDETYSPVAIGVEEDGLNEFILQPLRHAQVERGQPLPVKAMKAPKSKHDFIRALQPFFKAGEIELVGDHSELKNQLLAFPTGKIDVPNALAYALRMRPGAPIYDCFGQEHISNVMPSPRDSTWLAVNATGSCVSAALVQFVHGRLNVMADWLREGDPGTSLPDIAREAGIEAGRAYKAVSPPSHHSSYDIVGLRAACAKIPLELKKGGQEHVGRAELRALMQRQSHGELAFSVSPKATWTLRALAGGYAKSLNRQGYLQDQAEDNPYKVLMEGIESFCALTKVLVDGPDERNYSYTAEGKRYLSALAR